MRPGGRFPRRYSALLAVSKRKLRGSSPLLRRIIANIPDKSCQLNRSTQHFLEVYSQEFESLGFFLVVDLSAALLTSPSFCTTASERVYITTSSGKDANGGLQGAEGDRRAAICGANVAGAGGL